MEKTGQEGRHGVMGDTEAGGYDVEIHDGLGDEERCGSAIKAVGSGEEIAEDAGQAGAADVDGGEPLVLIGGGHQGGAGGPECIEDDDEEKNGE